MEHLSRRSTLLGGLALGIASVFAVTGTASAVGVQWGWRYCRDCKGLFYGGAGNGVCTADGNGHDPSLSGDYGLEYAYNPVPADYQSDWRLCVRCQGLAYDSPGGVCPSDGERHSTVGSYDYALYHGSGYPWRQGDWRHCIRCQGLHYAGVTPLGWCPAIGRHSTQGSLAHRLLS
ncbi:hypothetical protein GCM10022243_22060 [Saccharothrix violaceirubra]|uniref:Uncharacterized protein n=1 Tax=Saccharothrix violaceirubra TaxID=413306 RepID=A0A7W7T1J8_9PSEU|nr:hypothetical protein [Saccharothrix violaceirubra]MBB4964858.1 hypothetical protein [Saccharothrix violaceirubra]